VVEYKNMRVVPFLVKDDTVKRGLDFLRRTQVSTGYGTESMMPRVQLGGDARLLYGSGNALILFERRHPEIATLDDCVRNILALVGRAYDRKLITASESIFAVHIKDESWVEVYDQLHRAVSDSRTDYS